MSRKYKIGGGGRRTRMVAISWRMSTACCAAARLSTTGSPAIVATFVDVFFILFYLWPAGGTGCDSVGWSGKVECSRMGWGPSGLWFWRLKVGRLRGRMVGSVVRVVCDMRSTCTKCTVGQFRMEIFNDNGMSHHKRLASVIYTRLCQWHGIL